PLDNFASERALFQPPAPVQLCRWHEASFRSSYFTAVPSPWSRCGSHHDGCPPLRWTTGSGVGCSREEPGGDFFEQDQNRPPRVTQLQVGQ
ncbi:hypothetical protein DBR06_SOUSAS5310030, partial [Sousa chinensis]